MKWHQSKNLSNLKSFRLSLGSYPYTPFCRQLKIFGIAIKLLTSLWWDKVTGSSSPRRRHRLARWLVRNILDLGPTFIIGFLTNLFHLCAENK